MKPLRFMSLLLIAILMLALVACGGAATTTEETAEGVAGEVEEAVQGAGRTGRRLGRGDGASARAYVAKKKGDN